jgi:hypothetical protein
MHVAQKQIDFERFAQSCGISAGEAQPFDNDLRDFEARLGPLSEYARKLLVHIAELAYHGRGLERKPDVAYLPELYESCGLGVETLYPLLDELKKAGFIEVEDRYPFEDVKILPATCGVNLLRAIAHFCETEKIPLRDVLVDLRFDSLR